MDIRKSIFNIVEYKLNNFSLSGGYTSYGRMDSNDHGGLRTEPPKGMS